MNARTALAMIVALSVSLGSPPAFAQQKPDTQPPSDRELLDQLNRRSTNDVDRELFGPGPGKTGPVKTEPRAPEAKPAAEKSGEALEEKLARELGPAAISDAENPLLEIARRMHRAEGLIGQAECGPPTQELQQKIVADLEELLRQAKKQCSGGQCKPSDSQKKPESPKKKAAQQKPTRKASREGAKEPSKNNRGPESPKESGRDLADRSALVKRVWGELPEAQRRQLLQLPSEEQFLPKYDLLIEQYYKRLLDEDLPRGSER